jgi:Protein of unknown function (DUF2917)
MRLIHSITHEELTMDNDLYRAAHELAKGRLRRIHDGQGLRVQCLGGCLWLTQDGDRRDIVLEAGDGFTIDRDGDTYLSALADSRFVVLCKPERHAGEVARAEPVANTL